MREDEKDIKYLKVDHLVGGSRGRARVGRVPVACGEFLSLGCQNPHRTCAGDGAWNPLMARGCVLAFVRGTSLSARWGHYYLLAVSRSPFPPSSLCPGVSLHLHGFPMDVRGSRYGMCQELLADPEGEAVATRNPLPFSPMPLASPGAFPVPCPFWSAALSR
jgi:hypothetical protein